MIPGVPGTNARRSRVWHIIIVPVLTVNAIVLSMSAGPFTAFAQPNEANIRLWACPERYTLVNAQPPYCYGDAGDVIQPIAVYHPAAPECQKADVLCVRPATSTQAPR